MNEPKEHFELGEALGLMDFDVAAKLSGSRFVVLKGALARLSRALEQFMLDLHTTEHGYTEIEPPVLVRDDAMFGTAQLPKFRDDQFRVESTDFELDASTRNAYVDARYKEHKLPALDRRSAETLDQLVSRQSLEAVTQVAMERCAWRGILASIAGSSPPPRCR